MNSLKKTASTLGISLLFISSSFSQTTFADTTGKSLNFQRLSGASRYETSIQISKQGWPISSGTVILASGNSFADALCAAPLAKLKNAPILLTAGNGLEADVKAEIQRLGAKNIFIIGGTGVISTAEETALSDLASIERIAGVNRYETSVKVAEKLGNVSQISVATGEDFADALSIASIAAQEGMPILLTQKDTLPESLQQYIKNQSIAKSFIIGGTGVVGSLVEASLPYPERLSGANRFETNIKVLDKFNNVLNFEKVFVAVGQGPSGTEFADALSGAALAAQYAAPLVLTASSLPTATQNLIIEQSHSKSNIFLLGGQSVVPESIKAQLNLTFDSYDKDNNSYGGSSASSSLNILTNLSLEGNNIVFENAILEHNLYVYSSANLKNVTVKGTLFIDGGDDALINLNNVTAGIIKIKSGTSKNITCTSVTAKVLKIDSVSNGKFTIINGDIDNALKIAIGTKVSDEAVEGAGGAGGSTGGGTGGSTELGNGLSDTTKAQLQVVQNKLPSISNSLSSESQKAIINQVESTISNMLSNPSYDYTNDSIAAKGLYRSLSTSEKTELFNSLSSNLDVSTLISLKSILGL